jgi:hypothetical protein
MDMSRTHRLLAIAALASIALHVAVLFGTPRFELFTISAIEPPEPLEARIVASAPPQAAPPKPPAVRKAAAKPRRTTPPVDHVVSTSEAAIIPDPPLPDAGYADAQAEAMQANEGAALAGGVPDGANGAGAGESEVAAGAYPVRHARLVYDLNFGGGPAGVVTHTWSSDGQTYEAVSIAEGIGLLKLLYDGRFVQRSVGRIGRDGLVPEEYTLQRGSAARSERAQFDWDSGRVTFTWKGERREAGLTTGTQDALSILHQVYYVRPSGGAGPIEVATSRKLGHYVYELLGERLIETPIGVLRTLHVRRLDDDGRHLDAWLDVDRSLLPARIVVTGPLGNPLEQVIREASVDKQGVDQ